MNCLIGLKNWKMRRITDFTEIKAYVDILNEQGHLGFKEPVNPFFWWNHKEAGKVSDNVHAYYYDGLVVVLELDNPDVVGNMLVFALCPQKNILKKILDICKNYDTIIFNSEFNNRYENIVRRIDGSSYFSKGRYYYTANGRETWKRSGKLL